MRPPSHFTTFGPVAFVFELTDTYGKDPFPEELINPFKAKGTLSKATLDNLINNLRSEAVLYIEADRGTSSAGYIQKNNTQREEVIVRNKKEIWVKILYNMVVNRSHPPETKFATILHELGHLYCGHLGIPDPKWKAWNDRCQISKNEREFEAESICWLVCERMGIKNPSAEYLSGYLDDHEDIPDISIDTVLKSVNIIESMINGRRDPQKEIITFINNLK